MSASRTSLCGLVLAVLVGLTLGASLLDGEDRPRPAPRIPVSAPAPSYHIPPSLAEVLTPAPQARDEEPAKKAVPVEDEDVGSLELTLLGAAPETALILLDLERHRRPFGDGVLRFDGLGAGSHTVGLLWPERGLASPRRLETILIKPGETARLSLRYPAMAAIEGELVGPDGLSLGGGAVVVQGLYIPVDKGGRFRCRTMPAGRSRVWLFHPEFGAVETEALDLRDGETRSLALTLKPQGRAVIRGEVRRGGAFACGSAVVLRRVDQARRPVIRTTKADERGAFSLRYLAAGSYAIEVDGARARRVDLGPDSELRVELFLAPAK